jgi:hypothetical protein
MFPGERRNAGRRFAVCADEPVERNTIMRLTRLLPLALAGVIAAPALAQQTQLQLLREITDFRLLAPTGADIGEIEDVLVDESGRPVAVTVEVDDDFADIDGEEDRVFLLDQLGWQNGNYVTTLTPAEVQALPPYDD